MGELHLEGSDEDTSQILGVTALWYRCRTPFVSVYSCTTGFYIIEWDMVINTGQNNIGDGSLPGTTPIYDLHSILNHEFGHVLGLDDLYDPRPCEDVLMWGYILPLDIRKRAIDNKTVACGFNLYDTVATSPENTAACFDGSLSFMFL